MSKVKNLRSASLETSTAQRVLSLHVWLKGLSPMIWRRLLVRDDSTLADLHYALQIAFVWDDSHLNHFHIHGRDYGVYHDGGIFYGAGDARLSDFSFRKNEKFLYEYDLNVAWQHVIRIEEILPPDDRKTYPTCIAGQGKAPPEDCGGHKGLWDLQDKKSLSYAFNLGAKVLKRILDHEELPSQEEVRELDRWMFPRKIDRRKMNRRLELYASGNPAWMDEESYYGNSAPVGD